MSGNYLENRCGHVVLVDTYGPSASRLAPAFEAAGYVPVRVQSTAQTPKLYRGYPDPFPYPFEFMHRGSLDETVSEIAPLHPVAVIAGCDHGVEFADALSEALNPLTGAPTNGTALSAARRDKYLMIERIKQCGLRGARQIRVESESQLREWHTQLGGMAILKPLRSAANDGVTWCRTADDSVRAFRQLNGRENVVNLPNDGVVAQEYLVGAEYLVNTVSRDGLHHVCDIWKTHRISANGVSDLVVACQILPATGEIQDQLVPYALDVLDALEIRHGAGHIEIKMTPDGPCLIEVGARVAGQDLPGYTAMAIGESQTEWTVDAYTNPGRFKQRHGRPYELRRSIAWALMVSPRSGVLVSYRALDAIKQLESFYDMRLLIKPGQRLRRTIDDSTYPVSLTLMHEVDEIVLRDLATLRYLDGEGFYELADDPQPPNQSLSPAKGSTS
ncbi:ATP-grasp domain-containing protein [Mycobacterium lacus]|uniref:ATP-grasp domain-containing protein n=3 Tax=Mycobacterium lacus TaxID=169765 RepID=A0A7I7NEH8_9MYCO|nr:ATP-grasp domain-containing protein [Mycobacterium lacus]MCV7124824.1 ATP-grasp domain-containing protein [Mycobacterium lacus]BBX94930.1 ATP-grasp domain-containing protein [Mycobacterium lacus]